MRIKYFIAALIIAFSALKKNGSAQTAYTEGTITYTTNTNGVDIPTKEYFSPDSAVSELIAGPATVHILWDAQFKSFVVMVNASAFNLKKAAIYTPDEIAQAVNVLPSLTFTPTSETKQISGFNCTKVVATDANSGQTYEVWITNDITVPVHAIPQYYKTVGGFPVQYTTFQRAADGSLVAAPVTVNSVSSQKAPGGTFYIPDDYDKISKAELEAMSAAGNK